MTKYKSLCRRIAYLESLLCEGKQDQENLLKFLGQNYYNKYNLIKNKITDPEYKDIYKLMKKDPSDVRNYIDDVQSRGDQRRKAKGNLKPIYNHDGWRVYRITTYEAAVYYGFNTKWCITGRYPTGELSGEQFFNDYIDDYDLDGGYYFYIKNGTEKYCLLRKENGEVESVWDAKDNKYDFDEIIEEVPDFPSVPGVAEYKYIPDNIKDLMCSGDLELVKKAINFVADINGLYTFKGSSSKQTLLCFYSGSTMSSEKSLSVVKWLIDNGANVNKPDEYDDTPLIIACESGNKQVVEILLEADADVNNALTDSNPLLIVCKSGRSDIVKILLEAGADANVVRNGNTPLSIACLYNRTDVVRLLLDYGADVNETIYKGEDISILEYACSYSNKETVELLLKHDTNISDDKLSSLLVVACKEGNLDVVKVLLDQGAKVNQTDNRGRLPLLMACKENNLNVVRLLLERGANANIADSRGNSPLSIALKTNNKNILNLLSNYNLYTDES